MTMLIAIICVVMLIRDVLMWKGRLHTKSAKYIKWSRNQMQMNGRNNGATINAINKNKEASKLKIIYKEKIVS